MTTWGSWAGGVPKARSRAATGDSGRSTAAAGRAAADVELTALGAGNQADEMLGDEPMVLGLDGLGQSGQLVLGHGGHLGLDPDAQTGSQP